MKCNGFFYIVPIFEAPVNGRKSSGRYVLQRIAKGRLAVSRWCVIGVGSGVSGLGPAVWGQRFKAVVRHLCRQSGDGSLESEEEIGRAFCIWLRRTWWGENHLVRRRGPSQALGQLPPPTRGKPCAVSYFCFRFVRMPIPEITAPETSLHTCKRKIPFSSPSIPRPRPQKGCRDHRIVRKIPPLCGVLSFSISPKHRSPVRSG